MDPIGTVLVTLGLTAIVLPLVEGRAHGWPLWTWISLAIAPLILGAFALQQRRLARRGGAPLIEPRLFAAPGFAAGLTAQLVFWCGQASFFLILSLYLQQGRGLSALQSGSVFTILAVAYLATSLRAPALTERHGRRVLAIGSLVLATGHALLLAAVLIVGVGGSVAVLVPGLLLVGAGMGLGITPLATIIMSGMKPEHAGATAGVLATAQNVGNSIGVAVIGVIFFGALGHGFATAFELGVGVLAAALIAVAALTRLHDPDLAHIRDALGRVLDGHEPFPAIAVDRHWNLVASNGALGPLLDGVAEELLIPPGSDGPELTFFSTITTFGTATEVTVAELSVEAFFPADPVTADALRDGVSAGR